MFALKILYLVVISFIIYRGRMGSDDLEAFNAAFFYFQNSHFEGFENIYASKNRTVWVGLDLLIINITSLIIDSKYLEAISKYLCGYILTLSAVLSFYLIYVNAKNKLKNNDAMIAFLAIVFCSPILTLATGDGIESIILLLVTILVIQENKFNPIIAYITFAIKFYQAPVLICIGIIKKKYFNLIALFILICLTFVYKYYVNSSGNEFPYTLNIDNYLINLYNIFLSLGSGFLFVWWICILLIIIGWKKETLLKVFSITIILMFLSIFPFWHGQGSGTRYIIPLMIIFLPEIILSIKKINYLKYVIIIYAMLSFPTIDFRNTSIYEYQYDVAKSGKAHGFDENKLNFYDYNNIGYHPVIFASSIFTFKLLKFDCNKLHVKTDCNNVYPRMLISRVRYSLEHNLKYTEFINHKYLKYFTSFHFIAYLSVYMYLFYILMATIYSNKLLIRK